MAGAFVPPAKGRPCLQRKMPFPYAFACKLLRSVQAGRIHARPKDPERGSCPAKQGSLGIFRRQREHQDFHEAVRGRNSRIFKAGKISGLGRLERGRLALRLSPFRAALQLPSAGRAPAKLHKADGRSLYNRRPLHNRRDKKKVRQRRPCL